MKMDEKLVRLRKEKGLTQLELAEAVKVSRQAVSKWESGSSVPSIENLKYLGELYSVPADYLVNDDIECIGCQEKITESPVKQQIGRKKYRWLIIAVCIIGLVMAGVMLYEKIIVEQPQNFNFAEMERDSWETTEADGFSMSW